MTTPLAPSSLLAPLFSSAAMRAITSDEARLQRLLDVEAALAHAEATLDIIPQGAAEAIARSCQARLYDIKSLSEAAVASGNIAIPLIKALTEEVSKHDSEAAGYVHWGATSQDTIDTALVLELRAAIDVLVSELDRAIASFTRLAHKHRHTPAVARTWLQQALPMPFGLKLAGYSAALTRSRARLMRQQDESLVLQFGGAAGTLAALEARGLEVAELLAKELKLRLPDAPWHTHRDRLAEIASALAILAGTCGKIARDVSLMMQTEVAEAFEPASEGRGGSSTMPHKRNPVAAAAAIAAATIAPQLCATLLVAQIQEHERAAGTWAAEWPTFPALCLLTSGALAAVVDIAEGLDVDVERMRRNLEMTGGQIMAEAVAFRLAKKIGKSAAHKLIEDASKRAQTDKRNLKDVLTHDARVTALIPPGELSQLFDPLSYQGMAQTLIDRLVGPAAGIPG
jgi:3-carboxy-cis,cis-muconate cycloisomerase